MPGPSHDSVTLLVPAIESLTGRTAAATEMKRFRQYLQLLLTWNRTYRLTGSQSAEAIVRELFLDSLLFLSQLPQGPLSIVDIGTGPGIPGVPLYVVRPEISLTLIESRRKHVSFLASLKRELDLAELTIFEGRAEALLAERQDLSLGFDVAVSRAVGKGLVPTAARYLKPGGLFVAGGPPSPKDSPTWTAEAKLHARWETVRVQRLGVSRTFLVGRKAP